MGSLILVPEFNVPGHCFIAANRHQPASLVEVWNHQPNFPHGKLKPLTPLITSTHVSLKPNEIGLVKDG